MSLIKFSDVNAKIITVRDEKILLDSDVAALYGVETKRINEAVKNNPDKFPEGYLFPVQNAEKQALVENFDRFAHLKHSIHTTAFTEKGLYMLATILKSPQATQTTIAIVEAFAQLRELSRTVAELSETTEEFKQKSLMAKGGEIIADMLGNDLKISEEETTFEVNFALMKFKHTVKRKSEGV